MSKKTGAIKEHKYIYLLLLFVSKVDQRKNKGKVSVLGSFCFWFLNGVTGLIYFN